MKVIIAVAGIDVNKFKAHSIRGATTSNANKLGLSTEQIIDRTNWAKAKLFYRFYNREVPNDQFQNKVLQLV